MLIRIPNVTSKAIPLQIIFYNCAYYVTKTSAEIYEFDNDENPKIPESFGANKTINTYMV